MKTPDQILAEWRLSEWVRTAAEKLSPPARERVELEIKSHYQDAVDARRSEGMPENEAQTRALEDLGDARAAARRFRKSHLTESEAKRLQEILNSYRGRGRRLGLPIVYGSVILLKALADFALKEYHVALFLPEVYAATMAALYTLAWWVAASLNSRSVRVLLALDSLTFFAPMMIMVCYGEWVCLGAFIGMMVTLGPTPPISKLRLLIKIERVGDVLGEISSPTRAHSVFGKARR